MVSSTGANSGESKEGERRDSSVFFLWSGGRSLLFKARIVAVGATKFPTRFGISLELLRATNSIVVVLFGARRRSYLVGEAADAMVFSGDMLCMRASCRDLEWRASMGRELAGGEVRVAACCVTLESLSVAP